MARRHKAATVTATLYCDDETDGYTVEISEWRRGSHAKLAAFLDCGPFGPSDAEVEAVTHYLESAVTWLAVYVPRLDTGVMF